MKFNFLKNKEKLKINIANSNSAINERTREKFILKGWIESNRKATCTKNGTRGFLFGSQTPSKMDFSAGRSMVEMLGVLAIIGVLSIGGISGYTIAMRRYRANEIANVMTKYAFIFHQSFQNKVMNDSLNIKLVESKDEYLRPNELKKITHFYSCFRNGYYSTYNCDNGPSFSNSGLGGLPAEINTISPYLIGVSENGGTVIILYVDFKNGNAELCKSINLILGDAYQSDYGDACERENVLVNGIVVDESSYVNNNGSNSSYSDGTSSYSAD